MQKGTMQKDISMRHNLGHAQLQLAAQGVRSTGGGTLRCHRMLVEVVQAWSSKSMQGSR